MKRLTILTASLLVWSAVFCFAQQSNSIHSRAIQRAARERWEMSGRVGRNTAALRSKAIQQKLRARKLRASAMSSAGIGPGWISLGPAPFPSDASGTGIQDYGWVSGRVTAIAIDPNDVTGNTVFVGGAYGGVWKSTNAGPSSSDPASVSWSPLTDDQLTLAVGAIAVQPQNSSPDSSKSVVLAGTGETNSSVDSYYGLGILRSVDGGAHWTLITEDGTGTHSFAGIGFSQIAFSTSNPNLVVAAAASASEGIIEGLESPLGPNRGLYFSNDGGATWTAATVRDGGSAVLDASATSVVFNAAAGKFYAALRHHGFYVSSDGANWTRLATQPGLGLTPVACPAQSVQPSGCPIYRGALAVVPNRAGPTRVGEIYLWYVDDNDTDQGIWTSTNGGVSWTRIDDSGITNCGDFFGGCGTVLGTYNLALAAVPNGAATDLYAGATNIYECAIVPGSSTCNGTGRNTFLNLTHVYGCSDIAKVHPNQHAMDFLVANGTSLMYFANDGGIYRALDAFTGLTTGNCGLSNRFDNLNATLGPLTQFVSIAQSASNVNLLWGGTQGNGAPATAFLQSGGVWVNVNAGDIGWTAISPIDDNEWFLSMPPDGISGVNVLRCWNGVNCHTQDFQNDPIVSSTSVGSDIGPFSPPFTFDPVNSSTMLLGTCRIWRGSSSGGSFSLLSPNFEVGGSGSCSGTETNMVRTLAVGGSADKLGDSQVIYAGTNGEGPAIATAPAGGHVWVTTNASGGPSTWADRTGPINPQAFPISSIVIDPSDPSGQTAFAGIMGFHSAHVWKTISAGLWWFDFSGNLPDVPVDALVVDPSTATIYAGTDIGVFASALWNPDWTEVGPPSGQAGYLPNVAITSLQLFNTGSSYRLRAGTYGRGIWELNLVTTPDFQISVDNSQQTVLAAQSTTFAGSVYALNGYASSVTLTCAAGSTSAPQNCSASPSSVTPTPQGTGFVLTASDVAGDYSFNLQANGTDPSSITHAAPVVLHVVDFSLGPLAPSAVTLAPGTSSLPISFSVSADGAFTGTVTLSCGTPPAGIACQFQPAMASPTAGNPVGVTLTISASSSARLGTSQLTVSALSAGATTKIQVLSITVGATPDYTVTVSNPTLSAQVSATATFRGTITAINGYNSSVNLSCGTGAPPSCTVNPTSLTPSSAGVPVTITVSSDIAQTYSFNLNAAGTDTATTAHSSALSFTAMPNPAFDFSMSATPPSVSVARGNTALFSVTVDPNTGSFPNTLSVGCSGLPALASCSFNPAQVPTGSGSSAVTVTMATTAPSSRAAAYWLSFPLAAIVLMPLGRVRRRAAFRLFLFVLIAAAGISCGGLQGNNDGGGGGTSGTKLGNYTVTLTATCGTTVHSTTVTLTVTP
jgi:hypothetical protein